MTKATVNLGTQQTDKAAALINQAIAEHASAVSLTGYGVLYNVLQALDLRVGNGHLALEVGATVVVTDLDPDENGAKGEVVEIDGTRVTVKITDAGGHDWINVGGVLGYEADHLTVI